MKKSIKFEDLPPDAQEYVIFRAEDDPIESFNLFIKRWVPPAMHGQLLTDDDNDAEWVRFVIRKALQGGRFRE